MRARGFEGTEREADGSLPRSRKMGQVGGQHWLREENRDSSDVRSHLVGSKDVAIPSKSSDSDDDRGAFLNAIDYVADKWGEPPSNYYTGAGGSIRCLPRRRSILRETQQSARTEIRW